MSRKHSKDQFNADDLRQLQERGTNLGLAIPSAPYPYMRGPVPPPQGVAPDGARLRQLEFIKNRQDLRDIRRGHAVLSDASKS